MRTRVPQLFGATMLCLCLVAAPAGGQGLNGTAADKEALVRYKLSHGYLVGDPARFERLKEAAIAAAAKLHPRSAGPVGLAPKIRRSWEGLHEDDLSPPDPTGAIGPRSFIQAINLQLGIYDRSGGLIDSAPFSDLTGSGDDFLSDPQILWDPGTKRFYYLILDVGSLEMPKSTMLWGFSKSRAPTSIPGSFCNYVSDFGWGGTIADYPKLGQTSDFLLIGVNIYPSPATFLESDVGWIAKPQGRRAITTCPSADSFKTGKQTMLLNDDGMTISSTPEPAKQVDPSSTGWILAVPDSTNSGASGTKLELYKVTKNGDGTANIDKVGTPVTVPFYSLPPPAPQKDGVHSIDTLDGRLTNAISAVDPSHGSSPVLWAGHTILGGAGAEYRWYEIDPSTATALQSNDVTDASLYVFNGGVAPDRVFRSASKKGFGSNAVAGFTTSSTDAYPAIQMISKLGSNPQSAFVLIKQSPGPEEGFDCFELGKCRWGDYAGAASDPRASLRKATGRVWLSNMWTDGDTDPLAATWRTWNWAASP